MGKKFRLLMVLVLAVVLAGTVTPVFADRPMVGPITWWGSGEKMVARYNEWSGADCFEMRYYDGAWRFWSTVQERYPRNGTLVNVYPASHPGWYSPNGWVVKTADAQHYFCTGRGHLVKTTSGYRWFEYNDMYGGKLNGFKVKPTATGMWVDQQFVETSQQVNITKDGIIYTVKVTQCWKGRPWFAPTGTWYCKGVMTWQ